MGSQGVTQVRDRVGRGSGGEDTQSRSPRAVVRLTGAKPEGVQAGVWKRPVSQMDAETIWKQLTGWLLPHYPPSWFRIEGEVAAVGMCERTTQPSTTLRKTSLPGPEDSTKSGTLPSAGPQGPRAWQPSGRVISKRVGVSGGQERRGSGKTGAREILMKRNLSGWGSRGTGPGGRGRR